MYLEPTDLPGGLQLSIGITQALMRYEMHPDDYHEKLHSTLSGADTVLVSPMEPGPSRIRSVLHRISKPAIGVVFVAVLVFIGTTAVRFTERQENIRWAKEEALPQIEHLIETGWRDFTDAYALGIEAQRYIPDDPRLEQLLAMSSRPMDVTTDPPGARVYMKKYSEPDGEWSYLGVTPIEGRWVPMGIFRWKLQKNGYEVVMAAASSWAAGKGSPGHVSRTLDEQGSVPQGMIRVAGADTPVGALGDFFIDRFEVTNAQFKEFVGAGGYRSPQWWQHEFIKDGRSLTFDEAMALFVDQTDRPGPPTWRAGDYIEGTGDYPVSGVSWYEAQAYANYLGRQLPTGQHWGLARGEFTSLIQWPQFGGYAILAPFSNFGSDGPIPVGSLPGITAHGVYDMAGNVREWCSNETPNGRLIRGGAWDDNHYRFAEPAQAPAFDRSEKNGFRTVLYLAPEKLPESVFARLEFSAPIDAYAQTPVSDEIFEIYKEQFAYDKTPLNDEVESRDDSNRDWVHERITLDAAYGNEQLILHLFFLKNAPPPYQTVIYFPGVGSMVQASSENIASYSEFRVFLSFLLKNGRAVVYPVYNGTFERRDDALIAIKQAPDESYAYSQWLTQLVKDFRRTIDYLETRPEIDEDRLAYYGMSWGGTIGAVIPAVEDRIKVNLLLAGGLTLRGRPEANDINYVGRIKIPTLMMNGRYDTLRRFDTFIRPMFDLLGTPDEHKALRVFETDHIPPMNEFIKQSLDWLDRYLGPVEGL